MTYEEAKVYKKELEEINDINSDRLGYFDELGKTSMGLTPDHVKALPEWKVAKNSFDSSFAELREFNTFFIKTFKKEYAIERQNKRNRLRS